MIERRYIDDAELIETRSETDSTGKRYIMGYFALKNSPSVRLTERINGEIRSFTETIAPDAFTESDLSNVIYTIEHNPQRIIGRSGANTQLSFTDKGLFAKTEIPEESRATTEQNDLIKNIDQKIIRGNSFAFKVENDTWHRNNSGELFRTITKIGKIVDITSTIAPAYPDTFVFTRSLDESEIKEVKTEDKSEETQPETFDKETFDLNFQLELLKVKTF